MTPRCIYIVDGEVFEDIAEHMPNDMAFEAWERMTYGGIGVHLPGVKGKVLGVFKITVEPEPHAYC